MDKEKGQVLYWPENEELEVAADNFFVDQLVAFEGSDLTAFGGVDFLEDPPSPSLLLDSLNGSATNSSSSNDQSTPSGEPQSESSATSSSLDIFSSQPSDFELGKPVPAAFTGPRVSNPVLSGGSISDSELLRLEGIDPKSPPKPNGTASSSPVLTNAAPPSPRKHNRVLDSIYATFRRVAYRPKPLKIQGKDPVMTMPDFKTEESTSIDISASFDLNDIGDIKAEGVLGPVDSNGIPVSPPLTGRIPPDHHTHNMIGFVSGHFDDPFCDDMLAPPAVINPAAKNNDPNLNSPIETPVLNDDPFYQHDFLDTNGSSFRPPRLQPKLRSTSSAEWPMEGILTNDNNQDNVWTSSPPDTGVTYTPDSSTMPDPAWWDNPQHTNGRHHSRDSHSNGHGGGLRNSSISFPIHGQQTNLPINYGPGDHFSGLMIHAPQPRAPQPAVLSSSMPDSSMPPSNFSYHSLPPAYHHSPGLNQQPPRHRRQYSEQRRPRPRAPSSGARHYGGSNGHYGTPLTSPRKVSSSSACYTLREESASPTPGPRLRNSSSTSSLAVRKRRSWSRRQGSGSEPRTPGRSASFGPDGARRGSTSSAGGGSSSGGGGGGFSIEFCNYTPNDKKVLMNGVAPSGSSKTKARREREAQEHKRKMSERYMQAIRAAGADVEKLKQNGFFNEPE
ncbi:hypothetical protein K449DRAFT_380025 [Hypoxylon sp. EC38]|nr:hypothetical protein K449DRAFT_380025 [Hypoxylon sp. EC38]